MRTETFIKQKLEGLQQGSLLQELPNLKNDALAHDLDLVDETTFARQLETLKSPVKPPLNPMPLKKYATRGSKALMELGEKLLFEGKCGALIVAGGQGSRLRYPGPKGCMPISLVKQKSAFQILAEKTKAASKKYGHPLPIAIMTSEENHAETNVFFAQHGYFGLEPHQVSFFLQRNWPFLDFSGNLFLQSSDHLAMGPNGNGAALKEFCTAKIADKWSQRGVEYVHFHQIDNPLADPFDAELIGLTHNSQAEVTINAIRRQECSLNVGVLVECGGKVHIIEYTELQDEQKNNFNDYPLANASLFCFRLDFMQRVAALPLPMHCAKKGVKNLKEEFVPKEPNAWKFENFIFDVLPFSNKTEVLVSKRGKCFAPLKNFEGEDSIKTVQAALLESDRQIFGQITGRSPSLNEVFELAQDFYYPTPELLERWKGKTLPKTPYLEEN